MTTPDAYQPADVSRPLLETTCGSVLRDAAARNPEVPTLLRTRPAHRYPGSTGRAGSAWAPNVPEWNLLQFGTALAGLTVLRRWGQPGSSWSRRCAATR